MDPERERETKRERMKDEARRDGAFKVKLVFRTCAARLRERERETERIHTQTNLGLGKKREKDKKKKKNESPAWKRRL